MDKLQIDQNTADGPAQVLKPSSPACTTLLMATSIREVWPVRLADFD
jgi:hypothetical protein